MLRAIDFTVAGGSENSAMNNKYARLANSLKKEQKLNKRLREMNYSLERFLTIIAHDLRAPYNTMLGYCTILTDNFDSFNREKIKEYLVNLHESANWNYQLTQNLLEWTAIQRGSIQLNKQEVNLKELIDQLIYTYQKIAEEKEIEFISHCPDTLVEMLDKNVATSVLSNLVVNSLKFTQKGGTVAIKANKRNEQIEFTVTDNGIGMFPSVAENLFKLSHITSTAGTIDEPGTGLGLILCKELLSLHDGEIQIKSKVGQGTRALVYFNHPN